MLQKVSEHEQVFIVAKYEYGFLSFLIITKKNCIKHNETKRTFISNRLFFKLSFKLTDDKMRVKLCVFLLLQLLFVATAKPMEPNAPALAVEEPGCEDLNESLSNGSDISGI